MTRFLLSASVLAGIFNRALIVLTVVISGCAAGSVPTAQISQPVASTPDPTPPAPTPAAPVTPVTPAAPSAPPASTGPDYSMTVTDACPGPLCYVSPDTFSALVLLTPTDPSFDGQAYVEWSTMPAGVSGGTQQPDGGWATSNSYQTVCEPGAEGCIWTVPEPAEMTWTLNPAEVVPGTYKIQFKAIEMNDGAPVQGKTPVTQTVDLVISSASSAIWQTQ